MFKATELQVCVSRLMMPAVCLPPFASISTYIHRWVAFVSSVVFAGTIYRPYETMTTMLHAMTLPLPACRQSTKGTGHAQM